jgi:phosphoglycerate dehydrogenase-like enzyme
VYEREPLLGDAAILSAPNTLLTPHLGYATRETYEIYFPQAVEDIEAWLADKPVRVIP